MLRSPSSPISNDGLDFDFFAGPRITETGTLAHEDEDEALYTVQICGHSLKLARDPLVGTGGLLWPAGETLAEYLCVNFSLVQGKRVLELGSGTGVVGLSIALHARSLSLQPLGPCCCSSASMTQKTGSCSSSSTTQKTGSCSGARTRQEIGSMTCTDLKSVLPVLATNTRLNALEESTAVRELAWGEPIAPDLKENDVFLLADCVYLESLFGPLVESLRQLMVRNEQVAYLCYKKRRKADSRFFKLLRRHFLLESIPIEDEKVWRNSIQLYKFTRKPSHDDK